jgi:hypothetical protein
MPSKKVIRVAGSNNLRQGMATQHQRYSTEPYDEVFKIVTGIISGTANDGFDMGYDGLINIIEIHKMEQKTDEDCKL